MILNNKKLIQNTNRKKANLNSIKLDQRNLIITNEESNNNKQ